MSYTQQHGINIGSWLCWGDLTLEERAKWFTAVDIHRLRDAGFDHLRYCLREIYFWDENDQLNPRAVEILRDAIDTALAAGLNISVNLHHLRIHQFNDLIEPPLYTDPAAQAKFGQYWKDVLGALGDYSTDRLAFEFLNEPVGRENQRWNTVWRIAYDILRPAEPERTLILGSNLWNQTRTFADLAVPENDPNMILDFHFYEPLLVTHTNSYVPWTNTPWQVDYPGRPLKMPSWLFGLYSNLKPKLNPVHRKDVWHENDPFTKETILERFMKAIVVAKKHQLPLNLGEFGLWQNSNNPAGYRWLEDVLTVCAEQDISWTVWSYGKSSDSYSVFDENGQPLEKLKILQKYMN